MEYISPTATGSPGCLREDDTRVRVGPHGRGYWADLTEDGPPIGIETVSSFQVTRVGLNPVSIMTAIGVGDRAPEFSMVAHTGEPVRLSDFRDDKVVVLFFYPRDGTPVCTKEACSFRDRYEEFAEAGAQVIGVSSSGEESHRAFAARHSLPFPLLSDRDGALRKAFGVPKTLGFLPGRVTYVIDKQGIVRMAFSAQMTADRHVTEAINMVGELVVSC